IPSTGLPAPLVEFLRAELRHKKTPKYRDLKIEWRTLESDLFFDIDRDKGYLYLNKFYGAQLLHGLSGSAADLPVVKCLLLLLVKDALLSERLGSKIRDKLDRTNRILTKAG